MRAKVIILVFIAGYWAQGAERSWAQDNNLRSGRDNSFANDNNYDPNIGVDQWRLVPHLGWRKFAPVDAFYFDWLNYRKTTRYRYYIW